MEKEEKVHTIRYGWEGHPAVEIKRDGHGLLKNRCIMKPSLVHQGEKFQVTAISLGLEFAMFHKAREAKREKKGKKPLWPLDLPAKTRVKDGVKYYNLSPFYKLMIFWDGMDQEIHIVELEKTYTPPAPVNFNDRYT